MRSVQYVSFAKRCLPVAALLLAACAAQRAPHTPVRPHPAKDESAASRASKGPSADRPRLVQTVPKDPDALAPSEVGYYMDVLLGRLRQLPGVDCVRRADQIIIGLSGRFDLVTGRARADADLHATLTALAQVLTEYRKTLVSLQVGAIAPAGPIDAALARRCVLAAAESLTSAGLRPKRVATLAANEGRAAPPADAQPVAGAQVRLELIVVPLR